MRNMTVPSIAGPVSQNWTSAALVTMIAANDTEKVNLNDQN